MNEPLPSMLLDQLPFDLFLRIAVGGLLGGLIGYERDRHDRPAGLRTHMIIGLASSTFMVVSTKFFYLQHYLPEDLVEIDTSRIAAAIVTGMGFLSGGAILRSGLTVQGLTTATALWLVGAIGMAAGSGMFGVAVFSTVVGVITLTLVRRLEFKDERGSQFGKIELLMGPEASAREIAQKLKKLGASVSTVAQERKRTENSQALTFEVRVPGHVGFEELIDALGEEKDVRSIRVEQLR